MNSSNEKNGKPSGPLAWIARGHGRLVFGRRVRILAEAIAPLIPAGARVLDIGCGDGTIGGLIAGRRSDLRVEGVEVMARPECLIPCREFDGLHLPFADGEFAVCLLVDVLHHAADLRRLLMEAARVSSGCVIVKDHLNENYLDQATLAAMDWVGNRPYGVAMTYSYASAEEWQKHFSACGLRVEKMEKQLRLYPWPLSWVFGRGLHFVGVLRKA